MVDKSIGTNEEVHFCRCLQSSDRYFFRNMDESTQASLQQSGEIGSVLQDFDARVVNLGNAPYRLPHDARNSRSQVNVAFHGLYHRNNSPNNKPPAHLVEVLDQRTKEEGSLL